MSMQSWLIYFHMILLCPEDGINFRWYFCADFIVTSLLCQSNTAIVNIVCDMIFIQYCESNNSARNQSIGFDFWMPYSSLLSIEISTLFYSHIDRFWIISMNLFSAVYDSKSIEKSFFPHLLLLSTYQKLPNKLLLKST